jgi:dienelactone hydrolase
MNFLIALIALASLTQAAAKPSVLWSNLAAGRYEVGFRQLSTVPVAHAWYPASSGGAGMTMRAYLGKDADGLAGFLTSAQVPAAAAARYVDAACAARRDAPALSGAFPIVALAQGNAESAPDQAALAEFIASHGYIVVTTDSPTIAKPMTSEAEVGPVAEQQALELARAVDVVAAWPSARPGVRFAIGHSLGARASLLMAMRDPTIRGVVSLDGGIGTATALDSFRAASSFDAAKAQAPILHFYEELDAFMTPDFTLLKSLPATLTLTPLPGMHHVHFTTFGFGAAAIPELAAVTKAGPELGASLQKLARDLMAFLAAHAPRV